MKNTNRQKNVQTQPAQKPDAAQPQKRDMLFLALVVLIIAAMFLAQRLLFPLFTQTLLHPEQAHGRFVVIQQDGAVLTRFPLQENRRLLVANGSITELADGVSGASTQALPKNAGANSGTGVSSADSPDTMETAETTDTARASGTSNTADETNTANAAESRSTESYNLIEIQDGSVRCTAADCPDLVCVNTGSIDGSADGQSIACLPHKLVVYIEVES